MFSSDMMSGNRGPGVIGTLLAILVVVGFGFLFTLASKEGAEGESQATEVVIKRQGKSLESLRASVLSGTKSLEQAPQRVANVEELTRLDRENKGHPAKIAELECKLAAGRLEISRNDVALSSYKNEYRAHVRAKAKGELMDKLVTQKGEIYLKVCIREVTAVGLEIRHSGGLKRVRFEELDAVLQERFQYDPKQKEVALAEEEAKRALHDSETAAAEGAGDQKAVDRRVQEAMVAKQKLQRDIAAKEDLIIAIDTELGKLEQKLSAEESASSAARAPGGVRPNNSNSIRGSIQLGQSRLLTLRAELRQMREKLNASGR